MPFLPARTAENLDVYQTGVRSVLVFGNRGHERGAADVIARGYECVFLPLVDLLGQAREFGSAHFLGAVIFQMAVEIGEVGDGKLRQLRRRFWRYEHGATYRH